MYTSIDEIRRKNHEAGQYFFTPNTMRFFRSKIHDPVYGGRFFVTSEQDRRVAGYAPRRYTVRQAHEDGTITTVGEFGGYDTRAAAHRAAEAFGRIVGADDG